MELEWNLVPLICGLDCSAYVSRRDSFAEVSKQLPQTLTPGGLRDSGTSDSKASPGNSSVITAAMVESQKEAETDRPSSPLKVTAILD
jgi:hypothetical protein